MKQSGGSTGFPPRLHPRSAACRHTSRRPLNRVAQAGWRPAARVPPQDPEVGWEDTAALLRASGAGSWSWSKYLKDTKWPPLLLFSLHSHWHLPVHFSGTSSRVAGVGPACFRLERQGTAEGPKDHPPSCCFPLMPWLLLDRVGWPGAAQVRETPQGPGLLPPVPLGTQSSSWGLKALSEVAGPGFPTPPPRGVQPPHGCSRLWPRPGESGLPPAGRREQHWVVPT